jgi:hypothetical protein
MGGLHCDLEERRTGHMNGVLGIIGLALLSSNWSLAPARKCISSHRGLRNPAEYLATS